MQSAKETAASVQQREEPKSEPDETWVGSTSSGEDETARDAPDLYDPAADEADAAWVNQQRQGKATDAILSCPGCLTTCCIDCQQHAFHPRQYRAMFVTNCRVDFEDVLTIQEEQGVSKKRTRHEHKAAVQPPSRSDQCFPVYCCLCDTRLGVFDREDIFHFTSVIASEA